MAAVQLQDAPVPERPGRNVSFVVDNRAKSDYLVRLVHAMLITINLSAHRENAISNRHQLYRNSSNAEATYDIRTVECFPALAGFARVAI